MMLSPRTTLPSLLFLLPATIQAVTLDCSQIRDDGVAWNLKALGGPKSVHEQIYRTSPPTVVNTTFTLDICNPLSDSDSKKEERCISNTRVCAKKFEYREGSDPWFQSVTSIAGEYSTSLGSNRALDPKFTRIKNSASNSDDKEGVIMELHGGKYPDDSTGTPQKAVIEFLCDKKLTGNEGFESTAMVDAMEYGSMERRAEEGDGKEGEDKGPTLPELDKGKSLQFKSYKLEDSTQVLRLTWSTKYACEDAAESGDDGSTGGSKTGGWGFFTWFIIIVFLLAAAYIIFGSWLNYNRYGARGWDLIPHGDTIRDIPYIIKDWTQGFGGRLKVSGSRGGYSAV